MGADERKWYERRATGGGESCGMFTRATLSKGPASEERGWAASPDARHRGMKSSLVLCFPTVSSAYSEFPFRKRITATATNNIYERLPEPECVGELSCQTTRRAQ